MAAFHPLRTAVSIRCDRFEDGGQRAMRRCPSFLLFCQILLLAACGREAVTANRSADEADLESRYAAWAAAQPQPPAAVVDRIETMLAGRPCIGRLDRWSRTYAFDYDNGTRRVDDHIIMFHLEEAGTSDVRPGRRVTEPNSWVNLDDRPIRMVDGDFDVSDGRLRIGFCGDNVGASAASFDQLRSYWSDLERRRSVAH